MTYTPFIWFSLISALVNSGLAYYTRKYQDVPSVRPFRALMWIAIAWALLYGLGISITILPLRIFIVNVTYIPSVLSTIVSLILALEYTGRGDWLTRRRLALLLIMPAIFLILAFTSPWHQLWRYDYQLHWSGLVPVISATRGVAYWAFVAYMLGLSFVTFSILVTSFRYRTLYFRNTIILSIGMLVPLIAALLYLFGLSPVRGFDWTPISFILTGTLYIWAVLRGGLFKVAPIARYTLVENLHDLMIAVNTHDLIIDYNSAAQTVLALSPLTVGMSPTALSQPWADVFQNHAGTISCKEEIVIANRTYELTISPILDRRVRRLGRLFLFHNITSLKQVEAEERKQRILAEALRETAEALNSTLNFDGVLEKILENVERVIPIDSANIAMLAEDRTLHYVRFYGYMEHRVSEDELRGFSLDTSPIFKRVFETGEPIIIPDTHSDPGWITVPSGAWIKSYAVMPIRIREKVVGVLNLDSAVIGFYTSEHIHILSAFADQAAIAVENARLFAIAKHEIMVRNQAQEELRQQNEYLSTLHQITVELLDRPKPASLLNNIAERAAALVKAQYGFIFLPEDNLLILRAATNGFSHNIGRSEPMPGTGVLGRVWQTGEIFFVENYTAWELHDPNYAGEQLAAIAGTPIKIGGKMVGVLEVANTDHVRPFSEVEIAILKRFALLASLVIDNTQLFSNLQTELVERKQAEDRLLEANALLETQMKQIQGLQMILREQAIRDSLTGLYNRRYLSETQDRELARAAREEYPISFVMIDIDHFKSINDTFGHDVGDYVLKKLSSLIQEYARAGDIICRYGGEEILAILPKVPAETAFQVTNRWRTAFMDLNLPLDTGDALTTISCGVSEYPRHGSTAGELITLADRAMYQAKAAGRNRVVVWHTAE
jgi:diguanylate cyclase (GGDEF)-like protein